MTENMKSKILTVFCGSECRGFESLQSPKKKRNFSDDFPLFLLYTPFTGTQGSM